MKKSQIIFILWITLIILFFSSCSKQMNQKEYSTSFSRENITIIYELTEGKIHENCSWNCKVPNIITKGIIIKGRNIKGEFCAENYFLVDETNRLFSVPVGGENLDNYENHKVFVKGNYEESDCEAMCVGCGQFFSISEIKEIE